MPSTTTQVEGLADLTAQLKELATPKENIAALRAGVRAGGKDIVTRAQANISRISPGEALYHKTYKGRLVGRGFASRSVGMKVITDRAKTMAAALVGVSREAFYALMFFERGTSKIPRQPWLEPAHQSLRENSVKRIGEVLLKRIKVIARRRARGK